MKKIFAILTVFVALVAGAALIPNQVIGDTSYVNARVISIQPATLYAVTGYNNTGSNIWIIVCETNAVPASGNGKLGPFLVSPNQFYSIDLSAYGATLNGITVVGSTATNTIALCGTNITIQGIIQR